MAGKEAHLSESQCMSESLADAVNNCKLLVVGAGGIGCELLKNLVLTGFNSIHVIDLDTIDVSNLNRQFLFQRTHVGKSKSEVARETCLSFIPTANITAHHANITNSEYNVDFFKSFSLVMNALDNRAARNHVNRMCLAADVPLIESGTAGYLGQVTVIRKGLTECYECQPKPRQKSYPGCTIRNTPSEPVHCIVWAKHLFNQLFGEADADEEVSPDTEDPELGEFAGARSAEKLSSDLQNDIERKSTRLWAEETSYNPEKLFNKFFNGDIKYLLSMEKLWQKRCPPTPLEYDSVINTDEKMSEIPNENIAMADKKIWNIQQCAMMFSKSVNALKLNLQKNNESLVWDKDDEGAMNFVAAAANIRSHIFSIPVKSRFDIKSIAGNIIPAIATTNAIIAALIVMESLKILSGNISKCKTVFLNKQPNFRHKLLVPCNLDKPNPKCYVCAAKPEVTVFVNTETLTLATLEEKVLKERLGMIAPDVEVEDGKGTVLISSEEGETSDNMSFSLAHFKVIDGARLKADDFHQSLELMLNIRHTSNLETPQSFAVEGDVIPSIPKDQKPDTTNDMNNLSTSEEQKKRKASLIIENDQQAKRPHLEIL